MRYIEAASIRRRARWSWLLLAIVALLPIAGIASWTVKDVQLRLGSGFEPVDVWWAISHFSCVVARTFFLVLGVALLAWIFGNMLRGAFRLPPRTSRSKAFRIGQVIFGALFGLIICGWSIDESAARGVAPVVVLLLGLLASLPLWYRLPLLLRGAYQALVERARVGGQLVSLAQLPREGRVRTAGAIRGSAGQLDGASGDVVYQRDLESGDERAASLLVEEGGERVWVDVVAGEVLVEADAETEPPEAEPHMPDVRELARLRVGDRVQIIGEVSGGAERGYRDALPRIASHDGRLFLLAEPSRLRSRLLRAALVESLSALALLVAPLGFVVWWWFAGGHAYL